MTYIQTKQKQKYHYKENNSLTLSSISKIAFPNNGNSKTNGNRKGIWSFVNSFNV